MNGRFTDPDSPIWVERRIKRQRTAEFPWRGVFVTVGAVALALASTYGKKPERAEPVPAQSGGRPPQAASAWSILGGPVESSGGGGGRGAASGGASGAASTTTDSTDAVSHDAVVAKEIERLLLAPASELAAYVEPKSAPSADDAPRFVSALCRLTHHPRPNVRRAAIACLARVPTDAVVDATLVDTLADGQAVVRREAVLATTRRNLGEFWPHLLPLVRDRDEAVRIAVADSLAGVADAKARDALRGLFVDPSDAVASAAARAAGRRAGAALAPDIVAAVSSSDPQMRLAAARALGESRSPDALRALSALCGDLDSTTRLEAIRGLAKVGGGSGGDAGSALESVASAGARARDERVAALEGLATAAQAPRLDSVLRVASDDPDPVVRLAASRTLLSHGDRRAVEVLAELRHAESQSRWSAADVELVRSASTDCLREAARAGVASAVALVGRDLETAMERIGARPGRDEVAALVRMVEREEAAPALQVVGFLSGRGGHASARGLASLAGHLDPKVREAALLAISRVRIRVDEATSASRAARADEVPAVRAAACAAMGAIGDAADVPSLLDALRSPEKAVVAAAYEALRTMSGARLAYRPAVWAQWWEETRAKSAPALARELTQIEKGGTPEALEFSRSAIERMAWSNLPTTQARFESWLDSADPRLQAEALGLIGRCRLGGLADRVARTFRFVTDASVSEASRACAASLGIRAD